VKLAGYDAGASHLRGDTDGSTVGSALRCRLTVANLLTPGAAISGAATRRPRRSGRGDIGQPVTRAAVVAGRQ
jgi:hypothetical protein